MVHAEHFLSRLDRFAGSEVELALGLYRDPGLLRAVLASVRLPEGGERVAISLEDSELGPFLVVTREGHFVTCLGRGMSVGSLPVIARGQLDALSHRFEALRERLALAQHLTGSTDRACAVLLRRLLTAADGVSREDFLAISAWEPLLAKTFLDLYVAMVPDLLEAAHVLRNVTLPRRKREELSYEYWNLLHAASHFALLGTMGGDAEHFQEITRDRPEARSAFGFALTSTGVVRFLMRGAWATGRLGKQILPAYKQALARDVSLVDWLDTVYALVALGRRGSGLRGEISKALHASHGSAHNADAERLREALGPALKVIAAAAAECMSMDGGEADRFLLEAGSQLLGVRQGEVPKDIPEDILRAVALGGYSDVLGDGRRSMLVLMFIAASARGAPEQFYVPSDIAKEWHTPWEPALTERVLEPMRKLERASRAPAVREKKPGPNEPCSCGSGRKYKKCCGAPGRA